MGFNDIDWTLALMACDGMSMVDACNFDDDGQANATVALTEKGKQLLAEMEKEDA